mmetsp:Transcript_11441/g.13031  ORF Transcript_11441/g.13031 Transcript_11441/m.13031 type:complete len:155 (+) Transcript_11441:447-911(+)
MPLLVLAAFVAVLDTVDEAAGVVLGTAAATATAGALLGATTSGTVVAFGGVSAVTAAIVKELTWSRSCLSDGRFEEEEEVCTTDDDNNDDEEEEEETIIKSWFPVGAIGTSTMTTGAGIVKASALLSATTHAATRQQHRRNVVLRIVIVAVITN